MFVDEPVSVMNEQIIDSIIDNLRADIKKLLLLKKSLHTKQTQISSEEDEIENNRRVFLFENGSATVPKVYSGKDMIDKLNRLDNVFNVDMDEDDYNEESLQFEKVKIVL